MWTVKDEIDFLKHMARGKNAGAKIRSWLGHSRKRKWPPRFDIDKCVEHAEMLLLFKMGQN